MSNYHDTSNSISVILKNHRQEIELSVKGYEVSVPIKSYWDNNWLIFSCRLREDDRSMYGEFPCFMTMELQRLKMLLEQYQSGGLPAVSWNRTEFRCLSLSGFSAENIFLCGNRRLGDDFSKICRARRRGDVDWLLFGQFKTISCPGHWNKIGRQLPCTLMLK